MAVAKHSAPKKLLSPGTDQLVRDHWVRKGPVVVGWVCVHAVETDTTKNMLTAAAELQLSQPMPCSWARRL